MTQCTRHYLHHSVPGTLLIYGMPGSVNSRGFLTLHTYSPCPVPASAQPSCDLQDRVLQDLVHLSGLALVPWCTVYFMDPRGAWSPRQL